MTTLFFLFAQRRNREWQAELRMVWEIRDGVEFASFLVKGIVELDASIGIRRRICSRAISIFVCNTLPGVTYTVSGGS